jgi:hypothetical protein
MRRSRPLSNQRSGITRWVLVALATFGVLGITLMFVTHGPNSTSRMTESNVGAPLRP